MISLTLVGAKTCLYDLTEALCEQFPLFAGAALVLVCWALTRPVHAEGDTGALLRRDPGPGVAEAHHHVLLVAVPGHLCEPTDQ